MRNKIKYKLKNTMLVWLNIGVSLYTVLQYSIIRRLYYSVRLYVDYVGSFKGEINPQDFY